MVDPVQPAGVKRATVNGHLSFLHFPGEIRNAIYEIFLLQSEPIELWLPGSPNYHLSPWIRRSKDPTGLIRVNKTVHREATLLFYGQNRFHFKFDDRELFFFFQEIGTRNASSDEYAYGHGDDSFYDDDYDIDDDSDL